jgi:ribonuclease HI
MLDSLQYKALLLCSGGMKGTPRSNLLIECGETSLAQRRFEFYMKFLTRMKFSNVSPCRYIFQDTIIGSLTKKFRSNEVIIFSKVLSECNVNIANLTLCESLNPPWSLPLVNVDISLHQLLSKSTDIISKFDNTNKFVTEHYSEHIQVFVDGSKTLNNQCGISLVVPSLDINLAVGVDSTASPLTAEMLAILNAVRFIEYYNISKVVIFSDCLTAVSNIKNKANSTYKQPNPSLCKTIQNYLEHLVGKVYLCWFPAHIGDVSQELADFCSKHPNLTLNTGSNTYKLDYIEGEICIEEHDVIHNLKSHFKERWRRLWLNNKPSMEYNTHLGFSETQLSVRLNRHEEKILNRLRLCTCGLKAYLFRIGVGDSSLCEDCGVPETVEHFILYCTKHQDMHKHLKDLVKCLLLPFDVRSVLNNNSTIKYVVSYILNNNLKL